MSVIRKSSGVILRRGDEPEIKLPVVGELTYFIPEDMYYADGKSRPNVVDPVDLSSMFIHWSESLPIPPEFGEEGQIVLVSPPTDPFSMFIKMDGQWIFWEEGFDLETLDIMYERLVPKPSNLILRSGSDITNTVFSGKSLVPRDYVLGMNFIVQNFSIRLDGSNEMNYDYSPNIGRDVVDVKALRSGRMGKFFPTTSQTPTGSVYIENGQIKIKG